MFSWRIINKPVEKLIRGLMILFSLGLPFIRWLFVFLRPGRFSFRFLSLALFLLLLLRLLVSNLALSLARPEAGKGSHPESRLTITNIFVPGPSQNFSEVSLSGIVYFLEIHWPGILRNQDKFCENLRWYQG